LQQKTASTETALRVKYAAVVAVLLTLLIYLITL